jgi:asparagine synthase (glutamine-hydrolysing)
MDLSTMDGVNTFFVSRETRAAGVKVALSGLGGDEVFAGYSSFRTVPRMERFARFWKNVPGPVRGSLASAFAAASAENDQNRKLASLARDNGRVPHPYFLARMLFTPSQRDLLLANKDAAATDLAESAQRARLVQALPLDAINRVSYLESRCYMLNTLLRDADFMSMSQGLEVRVPLIDHLLARTVLALPGAWKLNGTPKKLLVEALGSSLPDAVVHRPKRGFTLPFEHWMRQELRSEIEPALDARHVADGPLGGLLDGKQVQQVWKDFLRGAVSWSRPWSLYVLQRWCELHL